MTRYEFTDALQRALTGNMSLPEVADNVRYYDNYIDAEIRKGQTEEEVMAALGDPRLIAKTILEADKHAEEEPRYASGPDYTGPAYQYDGSGNGGEEENSVRRVPGWLVAVIAAAVIIMVIGLITSLLSFILPILLPVLSVLFIIRLFQRRR